MNQVCEKNEPISFDHHYYLNLAYIQTSLYVLLDVSSWTAWHSSWWMHKPMAAHWTPQVYI